jgi:hypothetical protein
MGDVLRDIAVLGARKHRGSTKADKGVCPEKRFLAVLFTRTKRAKKKQPFFSTPVQSGPRRFREIDRLRPRKKRRCFAQYMREPMKNWRT